MKILIIKKRIIILIIFIIVLCLFSFGIYKFFNKGATKETISPIEYGKETPFDFNVDGKEDSLEVISTNHYDDIKITIGNKHYNLSKLCPQEVLGESKPYWSTKVYVQNISRNSAPEIIVQTYNNSPVTYIFSWDTDNFKLLYTSTTNLFGILDSKGEKTPQCYSFNSSSDKSKPSFMIINKEIVDTTGQGKNIPDLSAVIPLVNLVEKNYELDSAPDIFTEDISEEEIGLLWNLDKENNQYSFQDGFFYDESIDNEGNITSMKWRLTFEKFILDKGDSSKKEIVIYVTTTRTYDNNYKISSLYKK